MSKLVLVAVGGNALIRGMRVPAAQAAVVLEALAYRVHGPFFRRVAPAAQELDGRMKYLNSLDLNDTGNDIPVAQMYGVMTTCQVPTSGADAWVRP